MYCATGFSSDWTFCGTDWVLPAGYQVCLHCIAERSTMAASGASVVDDRAGIMFGVELFVPWDAPEAVVDVLSAGVVPLRSVPDVLQGRDARSVRVLVLDCRGLDLNFHDLTIVDMGNVPESHISLPELSTLIQQWPPAVINHMGWRQREVEEMRAAAKTRYRQSRPSCCTFCGILIKCDMYWHVARCHLDLARLWRCTVWKGMPQDCMDHIRGAHIRGRSSQPAWRSIFPPWTVTRQVWTDSLTPRHSGISTEVLLFSDIGLSLVHHYRVHKRGLPHIAFRRNYMPQLHALLPLPAVLPIAGESRPDARSGADDQSELWSRLYRTFRSSRCRTRWLRRGQWCSIVAPVAASVDGHQWCGLVGDSGSGSCSVGGFAQFDLPGVGCYSTGGPRYGCGR